MQCLDSIKHDLVKTVKDAAFVSAYPHTTYAQIFSSKTQPAIIVQPKNPHQTVTKTKSDILRNAEHGDMNM